MIRKHFDGTVAWTQGRQTHRFLEAPNGVSQVATQRTRGYASVTTTRPVLFLIAGKLDFAWLTSHAT
jgi:hypothetical protein